MTRNQKRCSKGAVKSPLSISFSVRIFFLLLTRTLKTKQPARSDTRTEYAFSVSFLVNTSRKHQHPVQERIWDENRQLINKGRRTSDYDRETGIHDSVV